MTHNADHLRITPVPARVRHQLLGTLRKAILELRFQPGDRLVERELCNLTGVSRTSLREALRQLESEGLVTIIPNRGPIVALVDRQEAEQIYDLRSVLEGFMGRRFAERASQQQIRKLSSAVKAFKKAEKRGEPRELVIAKGIFYDVLIAGSGNKALENTLRQLHGRVTLLRATSMAQPGRVEKSLEELEAIVTAVTARDPAAAALACSAHVRNAAKSALEMLDNIPGSERQIKGNSGASVK